MKGSRRGWLGVAMLFVVCAFARAARGEDPPVPVGLQAELLAKVTAYDKSLPARAGGRVKIVVLAKAGSADSERVAAHMYAALAQLGPIAGLPHEQVIVKWESGAAFAQLVRASKIAIVYLTPGFGDDIDRIRSSLDGVDVLSAGAIPEYVPRGIVLGFDLVSGKPKLSVHLSQARRQNVAFKSEALKLMRIYE